ncbi:hypothetical protein ACB098_10G045400 [Castanea mollissima]
MGRNQQQNGRKIEEMAEKYEGNKANPQRNNENCWGIDPLATKTMETRLRIRENSANIEVKCARVDGKKKKKNRRKRRYCERKSSGIVQSTRRGQNIGTEHGRIRRRRRKGKTEATLVKNRRNHGMTC